ncbi:MAG: hypothetical protein A2504_13845 [Bdellovibrionales bacterium RIFOXYD12_FULL_39_22]|nr:MAG: hypothetical protein A2385_00570 [Bdellovibrionales bacterium RIFOXYB1_FULL_39_21]OFZ43829.1 MAG: hypothetical protein A2485_04960 [Bdellovibrionales bacterium RIFOXYC12_FULL_39_17]OFZ48837.1 MAG: hypothetical protein A2404_17885 [Bdellovibrionales bacterium RIFOXYC1_FULL_39_130]OFZ76570.1 MAG: hypothetical protein A2560_06550 [Bdellovibrionales bacterium RIFOXYD1_FULL_39_84]OFZ94804.1 MAG: hypothetical protein A2504_13845 [Bdellovibrionales bacterium RIFOXYD12_FULL_39_22]HLE12228.1 hy
MSVTKLIFYIYLLIAILACRPHVVINPVGEDLGSDSSQAEISATVGMTPTTSATAEVSRTATPAATATATASASASPFPTATVSSATNYVNTTTFLTTTTAAKMQNPNTEEYQSFGSVVAIDRDFAVVGASMDSSVDLYAGAVVIYRKVNSSWSFFQKIAPPDPVTAHFFGCSVAISGEFIVAGACGDVEKGSSAGAVYIYKFNGSEWRFYAKLVPNDLQELDSFGYAVAIFENKIAIGARGYRSSMGAVYVYKIDGTAILEQTKIIPAGREKDYFGGAVSLSSSFLAVGAIGDDTNGTNSGAVYIYNAADWSLKKKLAPSTTSDGYIFGQALSLSGEQLIIGVPGDDTKAIMGGSVYLYRYLNSEWALSYKVVPSDNGIYDLFGQSLALSGDYLAVGAPGDSDRASRGGSAYVFKLESGIGTQLRKIYSPSPESYGNFGVSVGLSPYQMIVGAGNENVDGGEDVGVAYIY